MGTVNVTLGDAAQLNLILGQQNENEVTEVVFDYSAWKTAYGSGTLSLSVQRPGDQQPYAVVMTTSGDTATWEVSSLDTAYNGTGEIQLTYTVGTLVKKSVVYMFTVYGSIGANGEYPSPGQTWQEEIEDELADVRQDLSQVTSNNLMGDNADTLYPVYLPSGTSITASTSDGSNFNQNYRIYYYDKGGNVIDWYGLYTSDGSKKTKTFNTDVYWLSWKSGQPPTQNIMINIGSNKNPYQPYYFAPHVFRYKGWTFATSFSTVLETGWYTVPNIGNVQDAPFSYGTYAQLRVYSRGISNPRIIQEVIGDNGEHYVRTIAGTGTSAKPWTKLTTEKSILVNIENQNEKVVSLSGNYFDYDNAVWQDGIYNSKTGAVSGSSPYKYCYVPLQGTGVYVKTGLKTTFGDNFTYFAMLDENKNFLFSVAGSADSSDTSGIYSSKITVTDDMAKSAKYTVLHMDSNNPYIPKLFYNANTSAYSFNDKNQPITYGFATNPLYKKTVICDGDSICEGVADLPKDWGAYFGRLKINRQISGTNYGVGGGTICDMTNTTVGGNPRHSVAVNIDTIHSAYADLDYLILEGGTNDADLIGQFVGDTPPTKFGTWTESDFSGNYDKTTFCGGVEYLFYKALSYYPHSKIGFIIAMEMGTNNATVANRKRYFDEIVKIAKKWHIPVLNLWENALADARLTAFYDSTKTSSENVTAKSFYYDGQHPTSYGYDKMQHMIEAWIETL